MLRVEVVVWLGISYLFARCSGDLIVVRIRKEANSSNGNNTISRCSREGIPDQKAGISSVCIDTDKKRDTITIAGNISSLH